MGGLRLEDRELEAAKQFIPFASQTVLVRI